MEDVRERKRPTAIITGASSGLGEEFAWQLAADGYDLLLVARRAELLQTLKTRIEKKHAVHVEPYPCDLVDPESLYRLEERVAETENLGFFINNAGYGLESTFPGVEIERQCQMLQLHCLAVLRLSAAALKPMCRQRHGHLINVASIAAFLFGTGMAQYSATKAYVLSLSRSMACDVAPYGVRVQALCPGLVHTGFHQTEGMKRFDKKSIVSFLWLTPEFVVRTSLASIRKRRNRTVCIPSFRYKFFHFLLTCSFAEPLVEVIYRYRRRASQRIEEAPPPTRQ